MPSPFRLFLVFVCILSASLPGPLAARESIGITLMFSTGGQRLIFNRLIAQFKAENPDIDILINEKEQESYKQKIPQWLASEHAESDVYFWFGGTKLRSFVERGWVAPIGDWWASKSLEQSFSKSAVAAVSVGKQIYGLPISYYQWGFYYRKSVFRQHGFEVPDNWAAFLALCEKMKRKGLVPIALGGKDLWPIAGWFDYLDLRLNGLFFHQALMEGRIAYTDPRVRAVFVEWRKLIEQGYFLPNQASLDWRSAMPYVFRAKAGMVLMGNFLVPLLPASMRDDIGFFRFPRMRSDLPYFEDAPVDILLIPKHATNPSGARKFLSFMARPDVQSLFNQAMSMISPHRLAPLGKDPFIEAGAKMLAEAEGIAQFFDRDTPAEMFEPAMLLFAKFMREPARLETVLGELESLRQRVFQ